jgi:hypothetical protein
MTTHLNRQKAGSRTRAAQALLGVLIVGGGAALAAGLRVGAKPELPPSGGVTIPEEDLTPKKVASTAVAVDSGGIAARMDLIANHPTPIPAAPPPEGPKTADGAKTDEGPKPASPELRYLGAVLGSRPMALVFDNGKQLFVGVGDAVGGGTVESISATHLKIGGDAPQTLELATKTNDILTRGNQGVRPGMPVVNRPGQPHAPAIVKALQPPEPSESGLGLNGEPIPPVPAYVLPSMARRYDKLREQLREKKAVGSEAELAEYAAKLLLTEEPKAVDQGAMEKQHMLEDSNRMGQQP